MPGVTHCEQRNTGLRTPDFRATGAGWGAPTQKHLQLPLQWEGLLGKVPDPLTQLRRHSLWFPALSGFTSGGTEIRGLGSVPSTVSRVSQLPSVELGMEVLSPTGGHTSSGMASTAWPPSGTAMQVYLPLHMGVHWGTWSCACESSFFL